MNHFELFGIPVSFQPDPLVLKKKFDELSRQYQHGFEAGPANEEQAEAKEKSAYLNKAYEILQDQDLTINYVLKLKHLLPEGEKYEPDPQFLLEVMDLNEELMELELDENREQLMNV